jgi:acyl-CoA dehydrogenase
VLNGQNTFITNGRNADLAIVATKTDSSKGAQGTSLALVKTRQAAPASSAGAISRRSA